MDYDNPKVHGDTSITDGLVAVVIVLSIDVIVILLQLCPGRLPSSPDAPLELGFDRILVPGPT